MKRNKTEAYPGSVSLESTFIETCTAAHQEVNSGVERLASFGLKY